MVEDKDGREGSGREGVDNLRRLLWESDKKPHLLSYVQGLKHSIGILGTGVSFPGSNVEDLRKTHGH